MKQHSTDQSGLFHFHTALACVLFSGALALTCLVFAAAPPSGSVDPSGPNLAWDGTATGVPPSGGAEDSCTEGTNCDSFALTISGSPSDWITAAKQVHVQINWNLPATDYDLYVHKGALDGPVVASSGTGGTTQEQVDLNPASSSIGTGLFTVHVVYYINAGTDQYHGVANVVSAGSASIPAPTPASGFAPRYEIYTPPAAGPATLGLRAGEPSIGIALGITDHPEGRALIQADLQTLRITFNDPCDALRALWENRSAPTSQEDFDPILFTDRISGRTIVHLLTFAANVLAGESSYTDTAAPDNDGDIWHPSTGAGIASGIDHQTVGGGLYHAVANIVLPGRAVYFCDQALVDASCARSDDGGATYGPAVVIYTSECGGLHGHVKVAPDGTVYVPNKGCGTSQGVVVSEDNGVNWQVRTVPGSSSSGSDPSVGIDSANKVYFGYADGDTKAVIATSTDGGQNWSQPLDVGAAFGINNVVFPEVVAGDGGRAAFAFLGTPTAGGLQGPRFAGVWHLYIATTYDGGSTWQTVDATPNDPVQRGCVWLSGGSNICRNMLDFMDLQIDQQGRVLAVFPDGCAGGDCGQANGNAVGNSYTAFGSVVRQSGGRRLLAAFDPAEVATSPGTPFVTATRNGNVVHLSWSEADNGGSGVTHYKILRSIASGVETPLTTVAGAKVSYDDQTATDPNTTYFYKVVATNSLGASCGNNEVAARFVGNSLTGIIVADDPTGDQTGGPAASQDLDIQALSIAEPGTGPDAGKLVFTLKVADLSTILPNRRWRIVWNSPVAPDGQFYLGMTSDTNSNVSFEYGTVATQVVGLVLGLPTTTALGTPDSGSFDPSGLITIVVSKDKIGSPQTGDLLGAISTRTYPDPGDQIRSTDASDTTTNATANDFTANAATYKLAGPFPGLSSVVSRKTHGAEGTFDINLPVTGTPGIEDRDGGTAGDFKVVFTFASAASLSSATVSPAIGKTALIAGTPSVSGNKITVNLKKVSDAQTITINLIGTQIGNVSVPMGILLGDVNSSRRVDSGDVTSVRQQNLKTVNLGNFRADVDHSGRIDSGDVTTVRKQNLSALP